MSSRLFKHQMACPTKPPVYYPQLFAGYNVTPFAHLFDQDVVKNTFTTQPIPPELASGVTNSAYSKDGKWFAVALSVAPFLLLYSRKAGKYNRVTISGFPAAAVNDVAFNSAGTRLYATFNVTPWAVPFELNVNGTGFNAMAAGHIPTMTAAVGAIKPSRDGQYIVYQGGGGIGAGLYKIDANGNYTTACTITWGAGSPNSFDWSADSSRLFMTTAHGNCFYIYHRTADTTFANVQNGSGRNLGNGDSVACNAAGTRFIVGSTFSPNFNALYSWNGTSTTAIGISQGPGASNAVAMSDDGEYAAVGGANNAGANLPRFRLWRINANSTATPIAGVAPNIPGGNCTSLQFAPPSAK